MSHQSVESNTGMNWLQPMQWRFEVDCPRFVITTIMINEYRLQINMSMCSFHKRWLNDFMGGNQAKNCSRQCVPLGPLHKRYPFKTYKNVASHRTPSNHASFLGNVKSLDGGTYKFIVYYGFIVNICLKYNASMIIHYIDVLYALKKMAASCNLFPNSEAKLKMSRVRVESSFSSFWNN